MMGMYTDEIVSESDSVPSTSYSNKLYIGDAIEGLRTIPSGVVDLCITSPPFFGLRDYGCSEQLGHEDMPYEYVDNLLIISREIRRVLKDSGSFFLNIADSMNGSGGAGGDYNKGGNREGQKRYKGRNIPGIPKKSLIGIPERTKLAHLDDGWVYRSDVIWDKSQNAWGDSARDRPHRAHEYLIHFTKSGAYYYDESELKIPGKNGKDKQIKTVWSIPTKPLRINGARVVHTAVFPEALVERPILAYSPRGGVVLDPFCGSGTVPVVAFKHSRNFVGIDLSGEYINGIAIPRLREAGYSIQPLK